MTERRSCLELAAQAGERLKAAGFEIVTVSMRSEAIYYRLPGRHGVLRVACHKWKGDNIGMDRVVATMTFRGGHRNRGAMVMNDGRFTHMVWEAIGQYVERSVAPLESFYRGKRGTWEDAAITSPEQV